MANTPEYDQRYSNYFSQFGAFRNCPVCDQTDTWAVVEDAAKGYEPSVVAFKADGGTTRIKTDFIPVVVIVCENCGYIREHSRKILDERTKEQGTG